LAGLVVGTMPGEAGAVWQYRMHREDDPQGARCLQHAGQPGNFRMCGSLRAAVAEANDRWLHGEGPSVVHLTPARVHRLTRGQLEIRGSISLKTDEMRGASPAPATIDAGGRNRHILIWHTADEVRIENLVLRHGGGESVGGAIAARENGRLTLSSVRLEDNSARDLGGALFSDRALDLQGCTVSGNHAGEMGGGIFSYGPVTMSTSSVALNSVGDPDDPILWTPVAEGGGIWVSAVDVGGPQGDQPAVRLAGTEVSDNTARGFSARGAGLFVKRPPNAEDVEKTTVVLESKTELAGNTASGLIVEGGGVSLTEVVAEIEEGADPPGAVLGQWREPHGCWLRDT